MNPRKRSGQITAPRPLPSLRVPMLAGGLIVVIALPVFVAAGWSLKGWAIAAALWIAVQAVGLFVAQLRKGTPSLKETGIAGFLMMARLFLVVVVLGALAMANKHLVLPVLAVYALAYTTELVLSLTMYFGNEPL